MICALYESNVLRVKLALKVLNKHINWCSLVPIDYIQKKYQMWNIFSFDQYSDSISMEFNIKHNDLII